MSHPLSHLVRGVVGAAALCAMPAGAQRYVLEELPGIGPAGTSAWDLNDAGTAVGRGLSPSLRQHALVWPGAGVIDLTPLNPLAEAQGISQGGSVAGWLQVGGRTVAALWTGGQPRLLPALPGHVGSLAQDANDAGLVAGWSVTSVGDPVAVVWIGGMPRAIMGPQSWAFAVSEAGDVVGRRWAGVDILAFRWRNGRLVVLPDLGPNDAQAVGTSPAGWIAGAAISPLDGLYHGVVWDPDLRITDLGTLGPFSTAANGVNDAGVAVGNAIIDPVLELRLATVWRGAGTEDLNDLIPAGSGWTLFDAQAVNARGEIVGIGARGGFAAVRAFLLLPDCDGDAVSDRDEIEAGTEPDVDGDGIADRCQE
jgi:uncharacterized membrane protein